MDTVSEVLDISSDRIEPPPSVGNTDEASIILGMGKVGDAVKILLDIDQVLTTEELPDISTQSPPVTG